MFSASATRLLRITDLRARNTVVLFHLSSPLSIYLPPFQPPSSSSLPLFLLSFFLSFLPPPSSTSSSSSSSSSSSWRLSNAADIRPGSRPFYVNHVVKDPTPPLGLEEALHVLRSSSKGRRRGTTLKRTTALIAREIRVARPVAGVCTLNIDFFFVSNRFLRIILFSFFLLFPVFSPPPIRSLFFSFPLSAPLALLASSMVLILRSKRARAR